MILYRSDKGFTLLEVMVALAIIATALITLLGSHLMSLNLAYKHKQQTLAAMLAYAASEDPERVPRDRTILPINPRTGEPKQWVQCNQPRRSAGGR